jgi:molybdate-binding protein
MLLRAARWEEGVTFAGTRRLGSVRTAVRSNLRWVGREAGSGARQCLDELLGDRRAPRHLANDHRGVAEAVRAGWADAGVCLRLTSEEAGLGFLTIREEAYDLCVRDSQRDDPRIQALLAALRSVSYRRLLGELPGYDSRETGQVHRVS